ncbi:MAG: hypothetical protein KAJ14_04530, partial [Candidatus Omnitrophica bacterium]|nr:hypothetical protein [Candidatus Omnitrophota bacterium]
QVPFTDSSKELRFSSSSAGSAYVKFVDFSPSWINIDLSAQVLDVGEVQSVELSDVYSQGLYNLSASYNLEDKTLNISEPLDKGIYFVDITGENSSIESPLVLPFDILSSLIPTAKAEEISMNGSASAMLSSESINISPEAASTFMPEIAPTFNLEENNVDAMVVGLYKEGLDSDEIVEAMEMNVTEVDRILSKLGAVERTPIADMLNVPEGDELASINEVIVTATGLEAKVLQEDILFKKGEGFMNWRWDDKKILWGNDTNGWVDADDLIYSGVTSVIVEEKNLTAGVYTKDVLSSKGEGFGNFAWDDVKVSYIDAYGMERMGWVDRDNLDYSYEKILEAAQAEEIVEEVVEEVTEYIDPNATEQED